MSKGKTKIFKELPPSIEKILGRLNQRLLGFSEYLQMKSNLFSDSNKKWILFLFCGVFITVSTLLIIGSLTRKYLDFYSVKPIRIIPLIENRISQPGISDKEFKQIRRYKIYLHSLPKASRDSLLIERPNIEDTINYLEAIYQQQIKK